MQKQSERAKPVAAQPENGKRQEQPSFDMLVNSDPLNLEFEKINQRIDFFDFNVSNVFTGVLLGVVMPNEFKSPVYLFSEYESHELFYVPMWHSLEKLKECEALGETVYRITHKGVRQIGNNQTYHLCELQRAKTTVNSRIEEIPDIFLQR